MSIKSSDPLLFAGKIFALFYLGLTAMLTAAYLLSTVFYIIFQVQELLDAPIESVDKIGFIFIALWFVMTFASAISFYFFQLLLRIIGTVGAGDPLTIENVTRLNRMGWIALIFPIFPPSILGIANHLVEEAAQRDVDLPMDWATAPWQNLENGFFFSMLLASVLFILARVFRNGAQMREDLDGTV